MRTPLSSLARTAVLPLWMLLAVAAPAWGTDFYELQIYTVDTTPQDHLLVEVHSNSITSATGKEAARTLPLYQFHNTLEMTYGLLPYLEAGQYFCTGRLSGSAYEFAGGRSKVHFGIPATESWPVAFGANIELQYMRRAAVSDPLNLEMMPILQSEFWGFFLVLNPAIEKQFSGPGTHQGLSFEPQGQLSYRLHGRWRWLEPSFEYFGEQGPFTNFYPVSKQQEFIVPAVNVYLMPQLEFNFGVGFGLTRAWNGRFVKGTIGWTF